MCIDFFLKQNTPDIDFIEKISQKCQSCRKCADICEYGAISSEKDPNYMIKLKSNNPRAKK